MSNNHLDPILIILVLLLIGAGILVLLGSKKYHNTIVGITFGVVGIVLLGISPFTHKLVILFAALLLVGGGILIYSTFKELDPKELQDQVSHYEKPVAVILAGISIAGIAIVRSLKAKKPCTFFEAKEFITKNCKNRKALFDAFPGVKEWYQTSPNLGFNNLEKPTISDNPNENNDLLGMIYNCLQTLDSAVEDGQDDV